MSVLPKITGWQSACKKSGQFINPFLRYSIIIGFYELNGHAHFWPHPPKNNWNSFLLSWICTGIQKISSFHLFIFKIQSVLESCDQTDHTHFCLWPPKKILSTFNLCEFVSTCIKSGQFTDLFWRYGWLKILESD